MNRHKIRETFHFYQLNDFCFVFFFCFILFCALKTFLQQLFCTDSYNNDNNQNNKSNIYVNMLFSVFVLVFVCVYMNVCVCLLLRFVDWIFLHVYKSPIIINSLPQVFLFLFFLNAICFCGVETA